VFDWQLICLAYVQQLTATIFHLAIDQIFMQYEEKHHLLPNFQDNQKKKYYEPCFYRDFIISFIILTKLVLL